MTLLLTLALAAAALPLAVASAYLLLLTVCGLLPGRPAQRTAAGQLRLAVVVPAHDEELLLPRLLESLRAQTYPASSFDVHVLADNCEDATARIARDFGAFLHERFDPAARGKGQALAWLLPQLFDAGYDAFVFIDADSAADRKLLESLAAGFEAGHSALQASYRVAQPDSAPLVSLRALAFALMHEVRGRGKARLGASCGIWGNGFAMRQDLVASLGWQAFSSVEDAEQHARLVLAGHRVRFLPEASVYGDMPSSLGSAAGQQSRWEAGRLTLLRRYLTPLLKRALGRADLSAAVAAFDLALPPLSALLVMQLAAAALALAAGPLVLQAVAVGTLAALALHVASGCLFARLKPRSYLALLYAPRYVAWKLLLYGRELLRRSDSRWVRTARS